MIVPKIPSVILKVEPTATMPPIAIAIYVNIFIIILTSAHFFAYQVCVRCAHTQILCVKNIIFHTMVPLF